MTDLSVVGNLLVEAGEVELVLYVVLVHLNSSFYFTRELIIKTKHFSSLIVAHKKIIIGPRRAALTKKKKE
jgi:hypothetical protein